MKCATFGRIPTRETEDWRREHAPHGEPRKTYPEPQPRSYRICVLVCPCGAKHGTMEERKPDE